MEESVYRCRGCPRCIMLLRGIKFENVFIGVGGEGSEGVLWCRIYRKVQKEFIGVGRCL